MTGPGNEDAVVDYVRRYRDQYSAAQLRYQLELAGHDRARIDAVFAELGVSDGRPPGRAGETRPSSVGAPVGQRRPRNPPRADDGSTLLVVLGFVVTVYALVYVVGLQSPNTALAVAVAALLAAIVGWATLRDSQPSVARGLAWGAITAIGLPVLALTILFGLCVAGTVRPI